MIRCIPTVSLNTSRILHILMFSAVIIGLFTAHCGAQATAASATEELATGERRAGRSIGDFLGIKGTSNLKSGYSWSLDMQGYKPLSAPGEVPRFALEAVAGNERWAASFGPVGVDNTVDLLAVDGNGNLYAAGYFTAAGGVATNGIAKWDGSVWTDIGNGIDGTISNLAVDGVGNLYAAGDFWRVGGVERRCPIAKWNGQDWSAFGSDMESSYIHALAVDRNGNLYVGGKFDTIGGVTAHNIATWNGEAWSPLGSGTNESVMVLALGSDGNLYAAGQFTKAGGIPARRIAKWNGSEWSALGSGATSDVIALAIDKSGNLYAGGDFRTIGGVAVYCVAKWNGSEWSALGVGPQYYFINALAVDENGNLYASGPFDTPDGGENIARWNGSEWSMLGTGIDYNGCALATDGRGNLYVGGNFTTAGEVEANNIAKWNGVRWSVLGGSGISTDDYHFSTSISTIVADGNGNFYAGGQFTHAGGSAMYHIAKWNGQAWSALGSGVAGGSNTAVYALALDSSGNLYAGGDFTTAGGAAANHIAKWDGNEWSAIGAGTNGIVYALATDEAGNLYAAGDFTTIDGLPVNRIATWNGNQWSALGTGMNSVIYALYSDSSGNLYAGGDFTAAGGLSAGRIAKWNGNEWFALGSGMDGSVRTLVMDARGNLFAGGYFTSAGDVAANRIAKWDGNRWTGLTSGLNDYVRALAIDTSGSLYAGGQFTQAGDEPAYRIAKWNGSAWSALGSGIVGWTVFALATDSSGRLHTGGKFSSAGGKPSKGFALWMERPFLAVDFLSKGLCLRDDYWHKINENHPSLLATWGDRLVMNFPGFGLFLHDGSHRRKISSLDMAESLIGIADSLYVDFGEIGIHHYKDGWKKIHDSNPSMMAACGEKLVANFPEIGIWMYDGSEWKRISSWTGAEQMVGIEKRLFVDFGKRGIYRYDGAWVRITTRNPGLMHAFGKTLAASIDSTSARGIYLYRNNSWTRISSDPSAEGFASTPFTLYVDRGAQGIAKYEKKACKTISPYNPDRIAIYGGRLTAVIPDKGLYLYSNPGWSRLSAGTDAGLMQGVLFE